ncbi:uncharacterized protein LOC141590188 [Silene latifolia]|uniref:uncharacterized protein LOC141590188 n=1 Tax=Silene latifolia TaxID=37657 RepID=UPI003D78A86C
MEILSRKLRTITSTPQVSYHPKCPRMQLTHLIFADDPMIFTRDDVPSVQAVTDALKTFGAWSGLFANKDKTSIYLWGTLDTVKAAILNNTGYTEGTFPFIYLGMLQLINSVIFGLENFWCTGLLLPMGVAKLIYKLRKYLFWVVHGDAKKWVWLLDSPNSSLWANWTQHYCLQTDNIWTVGAKDNFSECLRGIQAARDYCINMTGGDN